MKFEEIRALIEAATPGPWHYDPNGEQEGTGPHGVVWHEGANGRTAIFETCFWSFNDARLAAAARTLLPLLLDVAEAAENCCFFGNVDSDFSMVVNAREVKKLVDALDVVGVAK